jgi:hypothetical protein
VGTEKNPLYSPELSLCAISSFSTGRKKTAKLH